MTRSYFPPSKESWLDISREERLFCAHLYEFLREKENCRKFIDKLEPTKLETTQKKVSQDALRKDNYEVGYEVCFYRDLAHARYLGCDRARERLKELDQKPWFSKKRTFDLCLFGEKHIIIVEAKAQTYFDLNSKQIKGLRCEEKNIKKLFEELGVGGKDVKIVTVCLASSILFCCDIWQQRKGHTEKVKAKCDFITTWKSLSQLDKDDSEFSRVMKRADCCYKE